MARTRAGPARKPLSKWPSAATSEPCRYCGSTVPDPATRADVEQNSIALTSRLADGQDQPSPGRLGHHAIPGQIRQLGLGTSSTSPNPADPTS